MYKNFRLKLLEESVKSEGNCNKKAAHSTTRGRQAGKNTNQKLHQYGIIAGRSKQGLFVCPERKRYGKSKANI